MKLRAVLWALPFALGLLGAVGFVAIVLVRAGVIGRAPAGIALAIAAVVATGFVIRRVSRVAALEAARSADAALGLSDRLTSALSFMGDEARTPLMALAISDGAAAATRVDPRAVIALALPRSTWALVPLAAIIALAAFVKRHPKPPVAIVAAPHPHLVVEEDALRAEQAAVRHLAAEAKGKDPELEKLAEKLDALLKQIDEHKLSRSEAFAQLEAAEAQLKREQTSAQKPSQALAAAQKALAASRATKALAADIQHDDLDAAQKELEKLAKEAEARAEKQEENKEEKQAQEELARALDSASRAMNEAQKKQDEERDKKIDQLKEEERRLQKQKQEHPDDEENERKLQRNQRELERLEREKEEQQEQRRQLQRLSKDMEKAAEELRKKMSPEAMRQMAKEMQQMENEIKKLGSNAQAQMQIVELKEVLRRAGRVEQGDGQGSPKDGQGKSRGKNGKDRDEQLREFDKRAGGQPNTLILGGDDKGQGSVMLPLPGAGDSEPGGQGDEPGKGGKGDPDPDQTGDGIGNEHDPNLLGEKTKLDAKAKLIHATGQHGEGPTRSQTILDASERGFSNQSYRSAYKDYSSVVEEVMQQEGVPPGYRYYVKRYFQLIRPRE